MAGQVFTASELNNDFPDPLAVPLTALIPRIPRSSLFHFFSGLGGCLMARGGGGGARQVPGCGPQGCIERGEPPPPPLQGVQPMPSHCLPDAKCQAQWHL